MPADSPASDHTPSTSITDVPSPPYFWGIDIGGTSIKCGLVDHVGKTVAFEQIPTEEPLGPQAAVNRIADTIGRVERAKGLEGQVLRIGIGAPGPMDLPKGTLVAPPQLPTWWEFPLCQAVAQATARPVSFLNDANAAAYGEFWIGSGSKHSSMILLTLGTGVGGGIIVENELVNGVNSFGSECGHILVDTSEHAQPCGWGGGHGQLEAYASATGVVLQTQRWLPEYPKSSLHACQAELTSKEVYLAARDGDPLALAVVDETARWLGIGVTTLVHTLDPGSVVLGGAMNFGGPECPIGQRFVRRIASEFQQRTFPNVFAGTELSFASLGADAGYLGAAGYAQKQSQ